MSGINDMLELEYHSRRNMALYLTGGAATLALAGCGQTPVDVASLEAQLTDILTKIQQGVKDACTLVPTANSVLGVLQALAGSNVGVAAFLALVQGAIALISQACPVAGRTTVGPLTVTANGKDVPIAFY